MSLARTSRLCWDAGARSGLLPQLSTAGTDVSLLQTGKLHQPVRWMSGGHHGPGVTYEGLTLHKPARWHKVAGEGFAGLMWFWILVRAYHDGSTLVFGHAQHFEHEEHHEESEGSE